MMEASMTRRLLMPWTFSHRADQVNHYRDVVAFPGGRVLPLECTTERANKIEIKVRLSLRREGVEPAVGGLGLAVGGVLLQVIVDATEAEHLQQPRPKGLRIQRGCQTPTVWRGEF
jgi:hypothetical protein